MSQKKCFISKEKFRHRLILCPSPFSFYEFCAKIQSSNWLDFYYVFTTFEGYSDMIKCKKKFNKNIRIGDEILVEDILKKDGLSLDKLKKLSYHSDLGIHLKKNLHYVIIMKKYWLSIIVKIFVWLICQKEKHMTMGIEGFTLIFN